MKIFGWMADHSGCGWYRIAVPLGQLQKMGHEATWNIKLTEQTMDEADVIIAQRTLKPGPTLRWQELAARRRPDCLLVFEVDDDLWSVDSRNPASRVFADPVIRANLVKNLQVADLVTVSTEPLAQVVRRWHDNVVVLPNSIPPDWLHWRPGKQVNTFTIGWQGGPTHDRDWEVAAEPIKRWFVSNRGKHPIEMHTVGEIPSHHGGCPQGCRREHFPDVWPHRHTGWAPDIPRYYRLLDWDVALAPLAPSKFNRSKSYLRALEAAMLGFPVVASNVEAYGEFVEHGVTGLLVNKPSDWGRWLSELVADPAMAQALGHAARVKAGAYSIENTAHLWEKAYAA